MNINHKLAGYFMLALLAAMATTQSSAAGLSFKMTLAGSKTEALKVKFTDETVVAVNKDAKSLHPQNRGEAYLQKVYDNFTAEQSSLTVEGNVLLGTQWQDQIRQLILENGITLYDRTGSNAEISLIGRTDLVCTSAIPIDGVCVTLEPVLLKHAGGTKYAMEYQRSVDLQGEPGLEKWSVDFYAKDVYPTGGARALVFEGGAKVKASVKKLAKD
ncbi:hypothetical protein [Spongorhabdus nitratireducens]